MALGISGYGNYTGYGLYNGFGASSFGIGDPLSGTDSDPTAYSRTGKAGASVSGNVSGTAAQAAENAAAAGSKAAAAGASGKKGPVNPDEDGKTKDTTKKPGRRSSPAECKTCKERKYQDGSNEANVSFKAAAHVSPEAAGAAVRAHEGMHVSNAYNKAKETGGKVLQASVSIHTAVCPECGRVYVSGGETRTMISTPTDPKVKANPYQKNNDALSSMMNTGNAVNVGA